MKKWITLLALLAFTLPLFAQTGAKQGIQKRLDDAAKQRQQQLEDAMGEKPPAPPEPPVATAPAATTQKALKSGWLFKASKSDPTLKVRMFFAHPAINPAQKQKLPALIVIQEWWGVNDDIQNRTKELAQRGFYAVAVDLYDNQVTADPQKASELKSKLTNEAALVRLQTGLDLLDEEIKNGVVDAPRIGTIGWCMGGEQALLLSLADSRVKATALFYGPLVTDPEKLKKLQGPVLGVFGNDDKRPSPDDVTAFKAALTQAAIKDVTIYTYDGVGHAFASKSAIKMGAYNEEKAHDAWTKTYTWLNEKLLTPK